MGMITTCQSIHFTSNPNPPALDIDQFDEAIRAWKARLQAGLEQSIQASQETLGHIEERVLRETREVQRQVVEKLLKAKADGIPALSVLRSQAGPGDPPAQSHIREPLWPGHDGTVQRLVSAVSQVAFSRRRRVGLGRDGRLLAQRARDGRSGSEQDATAAQASLVIERLAGVKIVSTLEREARRQGRRAEEQRRQLDQKMRRPEGRSQQARDLQMVLPLAPFTLVIQMDAWNIRERDDWGQSAAKRAAGQEPARWHWVYGGTCFRLSQRVKTAADDP